MVSTCSSASGSLAAFTSRTILPVSSTMQTLVSLTETSQSSKMVHAALLLLMLQAAYAAHQPEAQHPNSSAIHKLAGRLPHLLERVLAICEKGLGPEHPHRPCPISKMYIV